MYVNVFCFFTIPYSIHNYFTYISEISNKYSKRWVDFSNTHNFWYSYLFILILILYLYYSTTHSKFEVLIVLTLNNRHNGTDYDSPWIDICAKHKICTIRIRILQYSLCLLSLSFFSSFFVNATTTKTVNADEWFES